MPQERASGPLEKRLGSGFLVLLKVKKGSGTCFVFLKSKITVLVPVPVLNKMDSIRWFRFRFRFLIKRKFSTWVFTSIILLVCDLDVNSFYMQLSFESFGKIILSMALRLL